MVLQQWMGLMLNGQLWLVGVRGSGSLLAVIPLANRDEFLRNFGMVPVNDRLMLRIGERDGTIIYSINTIYRA